MQEKKRGELVENYRIERKLGEGAASIIYLVYETGSPLTNGQLWALKHVEKNDPKDQRFLDQAEAEYRIASQLDHPGIRKIERLIKKRTNFIAVRELYLVMEFVDGISEDRQPPRSMEEAVNIFYQVGRALGHMHDRGFAHADMKPHNIMMTEEGAKIIDLGQSCPIGTVKERIQGTPDYIAPEQVHRRAITERTDIYNLGATMYWTLTRRHIPTALAKDDSLVGSLDDHMIEKAIPAIDLEPRIHPRLNELIMHCIQVDPEKRPESMKLVTERLNLILGIVRAEKERTRAGMRAIKEG